MEDPQQLLISPLDPNVPSTQSSIVPSPSRLSNRIQMPGQVSIRSKADDGPRGMTQFSLPKIKELKQRPGVEFRSQSTIELRFPEKKSQVVDPYADKMGRQTFRRIRYSSLQKQETTSPFIIKKDREKLLQVKRHEKLMKMLNNSSYQALPSHRLVNNIHVEFDRVAQNLQRFEEKYMSTSRVEPTEGSADEDTRDMINPIHNISVIMISQNNLPKNEEALLSDRKDSIFDIKTNKQVSIRSEDESFIVEEKELTRSVEKSMRMPVHFSQQPPPKSPSDSTNRKKDELLTRRSSGSKMRGKLVRNRLASETPQVAPLQKKKGIVILGNQIQASDTKQKLGKMAPHIRSETKLGGKHLRYKAIQLPNVGSTHCEDEKFSKKGALDLKKVSSVASEAMIASSVPSSQRGFDKKGEPNTAGIPSSEVMPNSSVPSELVLNNGSSKLLGGFDIDKLVAKADTRKSAHPKQLKESAPQSLLASDHFDKSQDSKLLMKSSNQPLGHTKQLLEDLMEISAGAQMEEVQYPKVDISQEKTEETHIRDKNSDQSLDKLVKKDEFSIAGSSFFHRPSLRSEQPSEAYQTRVQGSQTSGLPVPPLNLPSKIKSTASTALDQKIEATALQMRKKKTLQPGAPMKQLRQISLKRQTSKKMKLPQISSRENLLVNESDANLKRIDSSSFIVVNPYKQNPEIPSNTVNTLRWSRNYSETGGKAAAQKSGASSDRMGSNNHLKLPSTIEKLHIKKDHVLISKKIERPSPAPQQDEVKQDSPKILKQKTAEKAVGLGLPEKPTEELIVAKAKIIQQEAEAQLQPKEWIELNPYKQVIQNLPTEQNLALPKPPAPVPLKGSKKKGQSSATLGDKYPQILIEGREYQIQDRRAPQQAAIEKNKILVIPQAQRSISPDTRRGGLTGGGSTQMAASFDNRNKTYQNLMAAGQTGMSKLSKLSKGTTGESVLNDLRDFHQYCKLNASVTSSSFDEGRPKLQVPKTQLPAEIEEDSNDPSSRASGSGQKSYRSGEDYFPKATPGFEAATHQNGQVTITRAKAPAAKSPDVFKVGKPLHAREYEQRQKKDMYLNFLSEAQESQEQSTFFKKQIERFTQMAKQVQFSHRLQELNQLHQEPPEQDEAIDVHEEQIQIVESTMQNEEDEDQIRLKTTIEKEGKGEQSIAKGNQVRSRQPHLFSNDSYTFFKPPNPKAPHREGSMNSQKSFKMSDYKNKTQDNADGTAIGSTPGGAAIVTNIYNNKERKITSSSDRSRGSKTVVYQTYSTNETKKKNLTPIPDVADASLPKKQTQEWGTAANASLHEDPHEHSQPSKPIPSTQYFGETQLQASSQNPVLKESYAKTDESKAGDELASHKLDTAHIVTDKTITHAQRHIFQQTGNSSVNIDQIAEQSMREEAPSQERPLLELEKADMKSPDIHLNQEVQMKAELREEVINQSKREVTEFLLNSHIEELAFMDSMTPHLKRIQREKPYKSKRGPMYGNKDLGHLVEATSLSPKQPPPPKPKKNSSVKKKVHKRQTAKEEEKHLQSAIQAYTESAHSADGEEEKDIKPVIEKINLQNIKELSQAVVRGHSISHNPSISKIVTSQDEQQPKSHRQQPLASDRSEPKAKPIDRLIISAAYESGTDFNLGADSQSQMIKLDQALEENIQRERKREDLLKKVEGYSNIKRLFQDLKNLELAGAYLPKGNEVNLESETAALKFMSEAPETDRSMKKSARSPQQQEGIIKVGVKSKKKPTESPNQLPSQKIEQVRKAKVKLIQLQNYSRKMGQYHDPNSESNTNSRSDLVLEATKKELIQSKNFSPSQIHAISTRLLGTVSKNENGGDKPPLGLRSSTQSVVETPRGSARQAMNTDLIHSHVIGDESIKIKKKENLKRPSPTGRQTLINIPQNPHIPDDFTQAPSTQFRQMTHDKFGGNLGQSYQGVVPIFSNDQVTQVAQANLDSLENHVSFASDNVAPVPDMDYLKNPLQTNTQDFPLLLLYAMNSGLPIDPLLQSDVSMKLPTEQMLGNFLKQQSMSTTLAERFIELDFMLSERIPRQTNEIKERIKHMGEDPSKLDSSRFGSDTSKKIDSRPRPSIIQINKKMVLEPKNPIIQPSKKKVSNTGVRKGSVYHLSPIISPRESSNKLASNKNSQSSFSSALHLKHLSANERMAHKRVGNSSKKIIEGTRENQKSTISIAQTASNQSPTSRNLQGLSGGDQEKSKNKILVTIGQSTQQNMTVGETGPMVGVLAQDTMQIIEGQNTLILSQKEKAGAERNMSALRNSQNSLKSMKSTPPKREVLEERKTSLPLPYDQ